MELRNDQNELTGFSDVIKDIEFIDICLRCLDVFLSHSFPDTTYVSDIELSICGLQKGND